MRFGNPAAVGNGCRNERFDIMKVLVIGGGGREHAIVDALSRSAQVEKIFCAPGNAGIARQAECVAIRETETERLRDFAAAEGVELTVVGPEAALAAGVVDVFRAAGLRIFGPTKAAARIESSKEFAKELMLRYGIPTAGFRAFSDYAEAAEYVRSRPLPAVLKYDGLAAGKGVVIAATQEEADAALRDMLLDDKFGAGRVVVEDFLTGPEFSFMCFVSGSRVVPMVLAQDHKRAFDGDEGPNTGGMGAYSPLPFVTPEDEAYALREVMQRTADAMVAEGCPFTGVLYGGLMKTPQGIKVIEFNARFGDPETEVVLPRLRGVLRRGRRPRRVRGVGRPCGARHRAGVGGLSGRIRQGLPDRRPGGAGRRVPHGYEARRGPHRHLGRPRALRRGPGCYAGRGPCGGAGPGREDRLPEPLPPHRHRPLRPRRPAVNGARRSGPGNRNPESGAARSHGCASRAAEVRRCAAGGGLPGFWGCGCRCGGNFAVASDREI